MASDSDDQSGYHTARGTLYLLGKSLVTSGVGAILYVIIARSVPDTSHLGLFQGIMSLIALSVVLAGSGFARAAIRVISFDIGAGNTIKAESTYSTVFILGVVMSLIISSIIFLSGGAIAVTLFHSVSYYVLVEVAAVDAFLVTMIAYTNSLLYALQRFRTSFLISTVNILLKLVISVILLLQVSSILYVIVAFVISDLVSLILFIYILFPKLRSRPLSYKDIVQLSKFTLPLYGSSVLSYLCKELDIYMLLILSSLSIVGIYAPAVLVGTVLFLTIGALDQAFAPYFPRVYGRDGLDSLKELSRVASRYLFLLYVPLCFLILGSIPDILTAMFGEQYSASIYPAIILVLSITFTSMNVIFANILMSTGHSRIFLIASFIALAVQLVISIILIPVFDSIGAAVARASSYALLFVCPALTLRKIFGLQYDSGALKTGISGSLIIIAILLLLDHVLLDDRFLPLNLALAIVSYLIFLRFSKTVVLKDFQIMNNIFGSKASILINFVSKIVIR